MAKQNTAKKVEVQEQIDQELLNRSKAALEKRDYDFSRLNDADIIQTAKLVCNVQEEMSDEKKVEAAKQTIKEMENFFKPILRKIAESHTDLIDSQIGVSPTWAKGGSIKLQNNDSITFGVSAINTEHDEEAHKKKKDQDTFFVKNLRESVEQFGLNKMKKYLRWKSMEKDSVSFSLLDKKIKHGKYQFQFNFGYRKAKTEED